MMASLGVGEVRVYRKLRVAFFSTGDELRSVGTPLAAGEVYDSNRYTIYGMLTRLNCDVLDMGVVPDVPEALERAFTEAAAAADVVITSGGVSVGEADYVRAAARQARRGAVLEDRDEARPPARLRPNRRRALLRLAGQSGRGDGDVLRVRPRRALRPAGPARRRAAAHVQGAVERADPQAAGANGISARHSRAPTAAAASPCAAPAIRARASCRRCRRRTASSCCPWTPAIALPAISSTFSCSRG